MDNTVVNAVAPWQGYLHWLGNIREGTGKTGNAYAFADFTLKYTNVKMEEKFITFSISDVEKVEFLKSLEIGTPIKVSWFPDATEFKRNDGETRWYPSLKAYNIGLVQTADKPKQSPNTAQVPSNKPAYEILPTHEQYTRMPDNQEGGDDLPF